MADPESKFSGFVKWTSGIAASVITAVLVFYLTRPAPSKPPIAPTEFDGFVADSVSHQLLRNASITVALGPYSAHQLTDTFGRYSIVFASPSADASMGRIEIQATGYRAYSNTVALRPGSNYAEVMLDAISLGATSEATPQPAPASTPAGATAAAPPHPVALGRAQIVFRTMPPDFMKAKTAYVGVPQKK